VNSHAGAVLDQLDRLFNRGTVAGLSEGALLERYVAGGDEAAFAALVARHGPMVLGVCRRVLRDERDVEDAFQATFLILVRRAGAIRDGDLVGRWLHGVAHRVAVRARAHSARRFVHEQSVSEPIESGAAGPAPCEAERRELAAIVDEEVTRLPSTLRAPVVLCYLEGMSHDEAARRLRWPVGTVRSRMARAREVLRHRLARRGVTADGAALAAALVRPPVPPEWLDATVRGSLNFATHPATAGAIASARSVALARRLLQTMIMTKLSYIGAAGLGIVLALGGVRTLAYQDQQVAKPIGLTSVVAQKPDDAHVVARPSAAAEPRSDERIAAMTEVLSNIQGELIKSNVELQNLERYLDKVRLELNTIRREQRPAPARPASSTPIPATPSEKSGEASKPEKPQYIELRSEEGHVIMVISPDGTKVGSYDPNSGKTRPFALHPLGGVRREFTIVGNQGTTARTITKTGAVLSLARGSWFVAMDFDRDGKVTQISAFNPREETFLAQFITEPVERSSIRPVATGFVYSIGRRMYGFSTVAKRWGVLEFPPGVAPTWTSQNNQVWAEKDGRFFMFNPATGIWDDIYARAIEDEPAELPHYQAHPPR
jgi:RNA polymerase sigma factor (sigma-70 family)